MKKIVALILAFSLLLCAFPSLAAERAIDLDKMTADELNQLISDAQTALAPLRTPVTSITPAPTPASDSGISIFTLMSRYAYRLNEKNIELTSSEAAFSRALDIFYWELWSAEVDPDSLCVTSVKISNWDQEFKDDFDLQEKVMALLYSLKEGSSTPYMFNVILGDDYPSDTSADFAALLKARESSPVRWGDYIVYLQNDETYGKFMRAEFSPKDS